MKKFFLIIALLFAGQLVSAQVLVTYALTSSTGTTLIKDKEIEYLKSTKTWFVVPDAMADDLEAITEILQKAWTITEIQAINYSGVDNLKGTNNTFFNIIGVDADDYFYIAMRLSGYVPKGNSIIKNDGEIMLGYFYLITDVINLREMHRIYVANQTKSFHFGAGSQTQANKALIDFFYNQITYYNNGWGHISTYLSIMNEHLLDKTKIGRGNWGMLEAPDAPELANLKSRKLYIPDYIFNVQQMVFGQMKYDTVAVNEMMAEYSYPFEVLPVGDIDEMILENEDSFYYLDFFFTTSFCMFVVMESRSHQPIYSHMPMKPRITPKDFTKLCAAIRASD